MWWIQIKLISDTVPVIAIRANMDALAIQEETEIKIASKIDGVIDACGHDGYGFINISVKIPHSILMKMHQSWMTGLLRKQHN